jgi:hypothetical protein
VQTPWLFGDPGMAPLGVPSLRNLRLRFPKLQIDPKLLLNSGKRFVLPKASKSKLSTKSKGAAALEFALKGAIFKGEQRAMDYGFFENSELAAETILLGELPWLASTWSCFRMLDLDEKSGLAELEGLSWREIYSCSDSPEEVILDVMQMLTEWLPYAQNTRVSFQQTVNLESLREYFEQELLARIGYLDNPEWRLDSIFSDRGGWGRPKKTLDDIGNELGLTRERVRQIESGLYQVLCARPRFVMPHFLNEIFRSAVSAGPMVAFETIKDEFFPASSWTLETFLDFLSSHFSAAITDAWEKALIPGEEDVSQLLEIVQILRDERSEIGFIRLSKAKMRLSSQVPDSRIELALTKAYPNPVIQGDYALVSRKGESGFIRNISQQLFYCSPLSMDQLYTGLKMEATYRNARHSLPDAATCLNLIRQMPDYFVSADGFVEGPTAPPGKGTQIEWIAKQIEASPGQVISKNELFQNAMNRGMKVSTVTMLLSYSPMFRGLGSGLVTFVGRSPSDFDMRHATAVAKAIKVPTSVEVLHASSKSFTLKIKIGTNFLSSGSLAINGQVSNLTGHTNYDLVCCESFETNGKVKAKGNFITGIGLARHHLLQHHAAVPGSSLLAYFDLQSNVCNITPE